MTKHLFYVTGTHCPACKALIEDILGEQAGIQKVSVDLRQRQITVETELTAGRDALARDWTAILSPHGYQLWTEEPVHKTDYKTLLPALVLGLLLLGLFFALQRSGIVSVGVQGAFTPWTALLIGVVASLSTCLAIVGGLVLSLSAKVSQEVPTARPFLYFHVGRLVGFALLGGVLGLIGEALAINLTITAVLGVITSLIMLTLGINLLDIFHPAKRLHLALPRGLFDRIVRIENGLFAPFTVGAGTFFLPCGFTQSMQVAALSSGSFTKGSLIMALFAIGTLPMLAALSFGSFRFSRSPHAPLFFKTAGVVVVGLGLFTLLTGLAALGIIRPLFNI